MLTKKDQARVAAINEATSNEVNAITYPNETQEFEEVTDIEPPFIPNENEDWRDVNQFDRAQNNDPYKSFKPNYQKRNYGQVQGQGQGSYNNKPTENYGSGQRNNYNNNKNSQQPCPNQEDWGS